MKAAKGYPERLSQRLLHLTSTRHASNARMEYRGDRIARSRESGLTS